MCASLLMCVYVFYILLFLLSAMYPVIEAIEVLCHNMRPVNRVITRAG